MRAQAIEAFNALVAARLALRDAGAVLALKRAEFEQAGSRGVGVVTAAVVALTVLSAGLATGLLVYAERFVTKAKECSDVARTRDMLQLQINGLVDRDAERERELLRYKGAYKIAKAQRDKYLGENVADLDDAGLRDFINGPDGLLPFPSGPGHRGSDTGVDAGETPVPVGSGTGADEPG